MSAGLGSSMAAGLMLAIFAPVWGSLADRYGRKIMVQRAMFGGACVLTLMGMVRNVYELVALRLLQGMLTGTLVASTTLVSSITPRERLGSSLGLLQVAVLSGLSLGPWLGGMMADQWGYRVPFYVAGMLLLAGGLIVRIGAYENLSSMDTGEASNHGLRQAFGGRGLLAVLCVLFFVRFSANFVSPIFPLFVEKISAGLKPAGTTGLLMFVTGIGAALSAWAVARLGDRVGHKRILVGSTLVSGLLSAPQALTRTVGQLLYLRMGYGLAVGGTGPSMSAMIGTSVSSDTYGRSYGVTQAAAALGMALGPLAGGMTASVVGLRWPFVIMGALLVASSAVVALFIRPSRGPQSTT